MGGTWQVGWPLRYFSGKRLSRKLHRNDMSSNSHSVLQKPTDWL